MKMKLRSKLPMAAVAALAFAAGPSRAANEGTAAFEQMKSLAGHWETEKPNKVQATLDLELTANGSAVIERFHVTEQGKPMEMITLYYLEGDQLKMTQYCMA